MAASLRRFASEAPEKPVVRLAMMLRSRSAAKGLPRACTLRISRRPLTSGRSTGTRRSKRPGRRRAESRMSARLVAARTMTPELPSKPSISVRIWLSVCSRSSLPPPPMPPPAPPARAPPIASISSINTMQGAFFLACGQSATVNRAHKRHALVHAVRCWPHETDTGEATHARCAPTHLAKEVTNPGRSDADKHLNEFGARSRDERDACLSCNCSG
mmetsp:Transcript_15880/g.44665  ORF Transcript_15880/g.44665 Transcript_15880/m.44665 type:complete len:216 (+) Transcript_15880:1215-1862(+)